MELMGLVLGAQSIPWIMEELGLNNPKVIMWSDSTIVLHQLLNEKSRTRRFGPKIDSKRFRKFVSNLRLSYGTLTHRKIRLMLFLEGCQPPNFETVVFGGMEVTG